MLSARFEDLSIKPVTFWPSPAELIILCVLRNEQYPVLSSLKECISFSFSLKISKSFSVNKVYMSKFNVRWGSCMERKFKSSGNPNAR